jgi:hypothetical protein
MTQQRHLFHIPVMGLAYTVDCQLAARLESLRHVIVKTGY